MSFLKFMTIRITSCNSSKYHKSHTGSQVYGRYINTCISLHPTDCLLTLQHCRYDLEASEMYLPVVYTIQSVFITYDLCRAVYKYREDTSVT